jgi:hypothetical protein
MSYYRNYYRRTPVARVTREDIPSRLKNTIDNSAVPQNTKDFLQSLVVAYDKYEGLTERQYEAFTKVEKRFSPERIAERKAWAEQYDDDKRKLAKICAEYYVANPPYFGNLARQIINEPDFIPTEKQYRAIVENKYAKKVIASTLAESKFKVGAMVMGRATATNRKIHNQLLVVIEVDATPVKSAAKGSKVYRVLPVGLPNTLLVEERDLKSAPKRKKK